MKNVIIIYTKEFLNSSMITKIKRIGRNGWKIKKKGLESLRYMGYDMISQ